MENQVSEFFQVIRTTIPILKDETLPAGLEETLVSLFTKGIFLDRERVNIILSYWHLPPMSENFFNYYFKDILIKKEDIINGLNAFIKDALWYYGDLSIGYHDLISIDEINEYFENQKFQFDSFSKRLEWKLIVQISPDLRGYLGYVSGERPQRQKNTLNSAELIVKIIDEHFEKIKDFSSEKATEFITDKVKESYPNFKETLERVKEIENLANLDLFSSSALQHNKEILKRTKDEIENLILLVDNLKTTGIRNQEQYLRNLESIDVYVATSMRDDKEYLEMSEFVDKTFSNPKIKPLNLRYFDPTLCYCDSRIDKGIIECLLVRSAKVTIYCAQEGDTFGKDSELAATLVQGKPAIVYVPEGEAGNKRAEVFKEFHPLALQIGLYDGVARGVIVVRTPDECAEILYRILSNTLETNISYEQHGIVLREVLTGSALRVTTGWGLLSRTFWNNFEKTKNPKSGHILK